jgi:tetratricopeptide (TPR) repeat protein
MEGHKLALILCVAASCTGCITETKSVTVPPDTYANLNLKGVKAEESPKRDAKPGTWVAYGRFRESDAHNDKLGPVQQNLCRDEARKAYQKAIDIDPKCPEGYIALANLFLSQDDCERAIAVYQQATKQNPKSALLWFEAGLCYCRKKDFPQALACLGKAHELDPQNQHIATTYGLCLARAGRPQDAVTVLNRVMNKADANYNVARMMEHLNQPEQARQFLRAALQEKPTHEASLFMMAQLDGSGRRPAMLGGPTAAVEQASWDGQ